MTTKLFAPGRIGGLKTANRLVVAPMTRISAGAGGVPTERNAAYYARYAEGGFGLVVTEGTYPDTRHSQGYPDQPGIATDAQAAGWRHVVDKVHRAGAPIVLQIMHAGALSQHNDHVEGTVAPSAVRPKGEMAPRYRGAGPYPMPQALTVAEIARIVDDFGAAAARAQAAGFDGVELHGANGYLADQFLTDYTNARGDEYGGPLRNRLRFHQQAIAAMRAATGPAFAVGVRISETKINDFEHTWPGGAADAETIFSAVAGAGASYIHISAHRGIEPVFGSGRTLAGLARDATGLPVIACGKLEDPARAEALLEAREADFIALGKAALADPSWPAVVAAGGTPRPFDPAMIAPVATLDAYEAAIARLPAASG